MTVNSWAQFPNHFHLTQSLEKINNAWLDDEYGVRLLSLGDLSVQLKFEHRGFNYHHHAATKISLLNQEGGVCTEMRALPFDSSVIDAVCISHVLEFSQHPHDVLREVHRILNGEKVVIIHLLNPFSLLGLHSLFGRFSGSWRLYHEIKWLSPKRIRDWLLLLGFAIEKETFSEFGWPKKLCFDDHKSPLFEQIGAKIWPRAGGVWSIKARKKEIPLTIDRLKWQQTNKKMSPADVAKPSFRK